MAATLSAMPGKDAIPSGKLISLINEFQSKENFEVVKVGSLGTAVIKAVTGISATRNLDEEAREALKTLGGIKKVAIVEYEDSIEAVRSRFTNKLNKILATSDLLVETKDGDDVMRIYGVVNDDASLIKDFVIYVPSDCTLICLFGSIPFDYLTKIIAK